MTQPPPTAHFYICCLCPLFFTFPTRPKLQCLSRLMWETVGLLGKGRAPFGSSPAPRREKERERFSLFFPVRKRRRRIADRGARIK